MSSKDLELDNQESRDEANALKSLDKLDLQLPPVKLSIANFGFVPLGNNNNNNRRKFSFPAALHSNLLNNFSSDNHTAAKRRFSNVGDVVSRKLSNTIGWRTLPVPPGEVVQQGKALCCRYVRHRLKRAGVLGKKLSLYRLRSIVGTASASVVNDVCPSLCIAAQELERMHPRLYSGVARQASSSPGGVMVSEKAAATLLVAIGREILRPGDITWGRVVSVYAVAGGLALDCVYQGKPDYLNAIVEAMADLLEEDAAEWIATNGGWTNLSMQCRLPKQEISTYTYLLIFSLSVTIFFFLFILVKFFAKFYLF